MSRPRTLPRTIHQKVKPENALISDEEWERLYVMYEKCKRANDYSEIREALVMLTKKYVGNHEDVKQYTGGPCILCGKPTRSSSKVNRISTCYNCYQRLWDYHTHFPYVYKTIVFQPGEEIVKKDLDKIPESDEVAVSSNAANDIPQDPNKYLPFIKVKMY